MRQFVLLAAQVALACSSVAFADEAAPPAAAATPTSAPAAPGAESDPCRAALLAKGEPSESMLDACLKARPLWYGMAGLGWHLGQGGLGNFGGVVQLNSNPVAPLFADIRLRVGTGGLMRTDLEAGYVLSSDRERGKAVGIGYGGPTTEIIETQGAITRTQAVVTAGLHMARVRPDAARSDVASATGVQVGFQYHDFASIGTYHLYQLHVIRNLNDVSKGNQLGTIGATAGYQTSMPSLGHIALGMEVGYVPAYVTSPATKSAPETMQNKPDVFITVDLCYTFGQ